MSVRFAGYAAIFDAVDRGGDVIRRGAFGAVGPVPLLHEHRRGAVGVIERIEEDARGLRVIGRVEEGVAVTAGTGLSFGYRVTAAKGQGPRELTGLQLIEVSLVDRPMQPLARVHAVESGENSRFR